jgi:hypothetical protein
MKDSSLLGQPVGQFMGELWSLPRKLKPADFYNARRSLLINGHGNCLHPARNP